MPTTIPPNTAEPIVLGLRLNATTWVAAFENFRAENWEEIHQHIQRRQGGFKALQEAVRQRKHKLLDRTLVTYSLNEILAQTGDSETQLGQAVSDHLWLTLTNRSTQGELTHLLQDIITIKGKGPWIKKAAPAIKLIEKFHWKELHISSYQPLLRQLSDAGYIPEPENTAKML